jgi:hypothetical protein
MRYFVKVAGQSISPREAWERAPHRRADWFPAGAPPVEYGAAGVDLVDTVGLERAMAAGKAALAAGYGQARADGLVPCGTCPSCTFGHPEGCRRPQSKAMARLRASQAADADRTRDQVVLAELEALTVELAARLG